MMTLNEPPTTLNLLSEFKGNSPPATEFYILRESSTQGCKAQVERKLWFSPPSLSPCLWRVHMSWANTMNVDYYDDAILG